MSEETFKFESGSRKGVVQATFDEDRNIKAWVTDPVNDPDMQESCRQNSGLLALALEYNLPMERIFEVLRPRSAQAARTVSGYSALLFISKVLKA